MAAFTKKDMQVLEGDRTLRKSVQLKPNLGFCAPLAFETNGKDMLEFPALVWSAGALLCMLCMSASVCIQAR